MMRYILLNFMFMTCLVLVWVALPARVDIRAAVKVLIIMLIATILFDSLIVMADIVAYNQLHILGVSVGKAPIEDFAYAIVAALFVPYLWERFGGDK